MDGYQKKKYVSKLIFIFLLGNDIDFGHQEAVNLLSSVHFSEKQIVREGGREGGRVRKGGRGGGRGWKGGESGRERKGGRGRCVYSMAVVCLQFCVSVSGLTLSLPPLPPSSPSL